MITVPQGTINDRTWTFLDETRAGPATMKTRYTLTELSADSYSFKWEMQPDGSAWNTVAEGKLTRTESRPAGNARLREMFEADQNARTGGNIDWSVVSRQDKQRRGEVLTIMEHTAPSSGSLRATPPGSSTGSTNRRSPTRSASA